MTRRRVICQDIGYGDGGKGKEVDSWTRDLSAHTVVRFNGGAQAGHRVVISDGREHVFSQFGSGSFVTGVRTFLSRHLILKPLAMMMEERSLREVGVTDILGRTYFDHQALIATPFHAAVNRLLELDRSNGRHGSCGMGIGQAVFDAVELGDDAVRLGDYQDFVHLERKMRRVQEWKRFKADALIARCRQKALGREEIDILEETSFIRAYIDLIKPFAQQFNIVTGEKLAEFLREDGAVIFEGAQGVLLDRWRGFMPYCTPSVCTFENAFDLLQEHDYEDAQIQRIGVVRAYMVRHGPGPFVTEVAQLSAALPDAKNHMHNWQREFRIGWLDLVALRYAIACCGRLDALAVTCLDRLRDFETWRCCTAYDLSAVRESDRARFFKMKDQCLAMDILPGSEHDLNYQHQLTERLMLARPCFEESATGPDFEQRVRQHLSFLTDHLGVEIGSASFGPAAVDVIRPWQF